jgi:hypothetical protein
MLWAALVVALGWLVVNWAVSGFPRLAPRAVVPAVEHHSFLDGYVNRPLDFAVANWLFLTELVVLTACAWGKLGKLVGIHDLIYPESRRDRLLTGLVYGLTFGNIWFTAYVTSLGVVPWPVSDVVSLYPVFGVGPHAAEATAIRRAGGFLLVTWPASLFGLYLHALLNKSEVPNACHQPWFGAGLVLSVLMTMLAVQLGWLVVSDEMISGNWRDFYAQTPGAADGRITPHEYPLHLLATFGTLTPLVLLLAFGAAAYLGRVGSPVWVVCLLVWLFNAVYGFVAFHFAGLQYVLLGFAVALWLVSNARHEYKLSFPGLGPETAAARTNSAAATRLGDERPGGVNLLSADDLLERFRDDWQRRHGPGTKPKLIVVATSGGGIRAAVWTGAVLEGLDRYLGGAAPLGTGTFGNHVRLMTGASGGMVAAGLYAGHRVNPTAGASLAHLLGEDALWPTMQTLVLADLPASLLPFHRDWDRARALEAAWHRNTPPAAPGGKSPFRTTFAELLPAERDGLAPSLVYCPVLVEDGRRLLVSNLDLGTLAAEMAPTLTAGPDGTPTAVRGTISRPAVELFKLFPDCHDRFEVGTAARMSATFPFVSPGVSLPTVPPRRVVDAGYFDNYGVNLAALWLYRNRAAVRKYCGGVAVVEIRAFPMEAEKQGFGVLRSAAVLGTALSGVSTPAEALAVVQSAGAYYRNDQLLGILDDELNARDADPFFVRVSFECPYEAAMSWALASWDRDHIVNSFADCHHAVAAGVSGGVLGLKRWFGDGGG